MAYCKSRPRVFEVSYSTLLTAFCSDSECLDSKKFAIRGNTTPLILVVNTSARWFASLHLMTILRSPLVHTASLASRTTAMQEQRGLRAVSLWHFSLELEAQFDCNRSLNSKVNVAVGSSGVGFCS